jgi:hypothetical protein
MMKKFLFLFMLILLCSSCITTPEEAYSSFNGRAKIISVKTSQYNPAGKNEYVDIFFDFIPDDAAAPSGYRYKNFPDSSRQLLYNHMGNHLKSWVREKGIKEGNVYRATRHEKRGGAGGAPVYFDLFIDQDAVE